MGLSSVLMRPSVMGPVAGLATAGSMVAIAAMNASFQMADSLQIAGTALGAGFSIGLGKLFVDMERNYHPSGNWVDGMEEGLMVITLMGALVTGVPALLSAAHFAMTHLNR